MDFTEWSQVVSAVFVGNFAALGFGYLLWRIAKNDQKAQPLEKLPFRVLALGIIPILIALPIIGMR